MSKIRDEISGLQAEQCKCKKKHNTIRKLATTLTLYQEKYNHSSSLSESAKTERIQRLGTSILNMNKEDLKNNSELIESESKEYQLKLREKMIQLLLSGVAFNCGLALYDATFETFSGATDVENFGTFLSLISFSLFITIVAVIVILYLDRILRSISEIFKMPFKYIENRGYDVTIAEIIAKSKEANGINPNSGGGDGKTDEKTDEQKIKERASVLSMITIFAKYFVNVISLVVALSYCASFQELFVAIYSTEGLFTTSSVVSLWIFAVGVIIISVILTVVVSKCIKAEHINKKAPNANELAEYNKVEMKTVQSTSPQPTARMPTIKSVASHEVSEDPQ